MSKQGMSEQPATVANTKMLVEDPNESIDEGFDVFVARRGRVNGKLPPHYINIGEYLRGRPDTETPSSNAAKMMRPSPIVRETTPNLSDEDTTDKEDMKKNENCSKKNDEK